MGKKIITGLKIWLILLLGGLIMLPITFLRTFLLSYNTMVFVVFLVISILLMFFIYGWLFIKFKKWIFK